MPLENTIADLWRLLYDHRSHSILTLENDSVHYMHSLNQANSVFIIIILTKFTMHMHYIYTCTYYSHTYENKHVGLHSTHMNPTSLIRVDYSANHIGYMKIHKQILLLMRHERKLRLV